MNECNEWYEWMTDGQYWDSNDGKFFFASAKQFYKSFYFFVLIKGINKLACFILAGLSSLAKCLWVRP